MSASYSSDKFGANFEVLTNGQVAQCDIFSNSQQPDFQYGARVHDMAGHEITPETYAQNRDEYETEGEPPVTTYQTLTHPGVPYYSADRQIRLTDATLENDNLVRALVAGVNRDMINYYRGGGGQSDVTGTMLMLAEFHADPAEQPLLIAAMGMIAGELSHKIHIQGLSDAEALASLQFEVPEIYRTQLLTILKLADGVSRSLGQVEAVLGTAYSPTNFFTQACDRCPIRKQHLVALLKYFHEKEAVSGNASTN